MLPDVFGGILCGTTCALNASKECYSAPWMCRFQSAYIVWFLTVNSWSSAVVGRGIHALAGEFGPTRAVRQCPRSPRLTNKPPFSTCMGHLLSFGLFGNPVFRQDEFIVRTNLFTQGIQQRTKRSFTIYKLETVNCGYKHYHEPRIDYTGTPSKRSAGKSLHDLSIAQENEVGERDSSESFLAKEQKNIICSWYNYNL